MILRSLLVVAFVVVGGCGCLSSHRDRRTPQPRPARSPVRIGALVQLQGAVAYLTMSELGRSEPTQSLAPLVHMLAAFYDWKDPGDEVGQQVAFLQTLCVERLPASPKCRSWRHAYWATQKALFRDALAVAHWYAGTGKDVGAVTRLLVRELGRLNDRRKAMEYRWPSGELPVVSFCRKASERAAVLEWNRGTLWVNGMQVMALGPAGPPRDPDARMALQSMILAGTAVAEARRALNIQAMPKKAAQTGVDPVATSPASSLGALPSGRLVLRLGKGLGWAGVQGLLGLLADVNLRRGSVRVVGPSGLPCLIPVTLSSLPLMPTGRWVRIMSNAVKVCPRSGACHDFTIAEATAERLALWLLCPRSSQKQICPVFVEAHGASWGQITEVVAKLWGAVQTAPTLWVGRRPIRRGPSRHSVRPRRFPFGPPPLLRGGPEPTQHH
ncbi:MAG: hypothetical protein J7M25_15820 [Deltaproteobacteria bacterium]|nr:hypothetical protein [Deltaproteobacteria bacterium]